jgi:Spy/CpxP family protein refolding chaperone
MKGARFFVASAVVAALCLGSIGCSGGVEHNPQTTADARSKAPIGATTHGVVKLVGEALGEVPLRADQRTALERLAVDVDAAHAKTEAGRRELMVALADQIEAGRLDRAALQPKLDRVSAEWTSVRKTDADALDRLHAILDGEQRDAFVTALKGRMKARHGEHGEHGDDRVQRFGGMHQLMGELNLTDEQRTRIQDALRDMRRAKEGEEPGNPPHKRGAGRHKRGHGGGGFEAFRSDDFEASHMLARGDHARGMMSGRFLGVAETILPILTPAQRKIVADKLRAGADRK